MPFYWTALDCLWAILWNSIALPPRQSMTMQINGNVLERELKGLATSLKRISAARLHVGAAHHNAVKALIGSKGENGITARVFKGDFPRHGRVQCKKGAALSGV